MHMDELVAKLRDPAFVTSLAINNGCSHDHIIDRACAVLGVDAVAVRATVRGEVHEDPAPLPAQESIVGGGFPKYPTNDPGAPLEEM